MRVFKSPEFQKKADKLLTKIEKSELDSLISDLKNDKIVGKVLTYEFLREKKIGSKRVYFLLYEDINIALLVSISTKKYQQETIDEIKYLLPEFKVYAYKLSTQ